MRVTLIVPPPKKDKVADFYAILEELVVTSHSAGRSFSCRQERAVGLREIWCRVLFLSSSLSSGVCGIIHEDEVVEDCERMKFST